MMNVQINHVTTEFEVRDAEAMLNPRIMARIVAEVKRQLDTDERLKAQRSADRSADARGMR
jgi:hypothetical protein